MFRERQSNSESAAHERQAKANLAEWKRRAAAALIAGQYEVARWITATKLEGRRVEYRNGHLQIAA